MAPGTAFAAWRRVITKMLQWLAWLLRVADQDEGRVALGRLGFDIEKFR
jgi:hypothetical protein